jgi:SAM-dependent methyltransferase
LKEHLTLYEGVNECVVSFVPVSANRILDVGCGTGTLGERLRRERERTIVGITHSPEEAKQAAGRLSRVICADLNTLDFGSLGNFDCIIFSHVLEHLYAPDDVLDRIRPILDPGSVIVVALPNVLWWKQRLQFLLGRWRYQDWGTLDRTHFRFFDLPSATALLDNAGYEILRRDLNGPFPGTYRMRKHLGRAGEALNRLACRVAPGLFAFQFVYLAKVKR